MPEAGSNGHQMPPGKKTHIPALGNDMVKQRLPQSMLAAAPAKLHQGRAVRHGPVKIQAAKPAVARMKMDFLANAHIGEMEKIRQKDHPHRQQGIDSRMACIRWIGLLQKPRHEPKIKNRVQFAKKMSLGNQLLKGYHLHHAALSIDLAHHRFASMAADGDCMLYRTISNHWNWSHPF